MSGEQASSKVVSHLEEIIRGRYGREIEIVRLMNLQSKAEDISMSAGADIRIPLTFDDLFLGQAVLRGEKPMEASDIEKAAATVKLALEPVLYREYLVRQEANQAAQLSNKHMDIKPSYLSLVDETPLSEEEHFDNYIADDGTSKSELSHSLIFLEGEGKDFVRRVAIEIHEQSSFWSFVQLKDLIKSVKELSELESLSLATIYVDSEDLQDPKIANWIKSLSEKTMNELLVLVHREPSQMSELKMVPVVAADRLPAHRLLRIESIQMLLKKSYN